MGEDPRQRVVTLLREIAEAMAAAPRGGSPVEDAEMLRRLAIRLLDPHDNWAALVLATINRMLEVGEPMTRRGALALAEMLRQLEEA
jgi:hypothetical protein